MIEEDLHVARERARRWDALTERRRLIDARIHQVKQALDATGITHREVRRGEETRFSSFLADQRAVERELARVGPAREVYEELLAREERRLLDSTDPRASELAKIGRLLRELHQELPARRRARTAATKALTTLTTPQPATATNPVSPPPTPAHPAQPQATPAPTVPSASAPSASASAPAVPSASAPSVSASAPVVPSAPAHATPSAPAPASPSAPAPAPVVSALAPASPSAPAPVVSAPAHATPSAFAPSASASAAPMRGAWTDVESSATPAQEAVAEFARELAVLGEHAPGAVQHRVTEETVVWVKEALGELTIRCAELGRMRDDLLARREELLVC